MKRNSPAPAGSGVQLLPARPLPLWMRRGFAACCLCLGLAAAMPVVRADDFVNISVKIICKPDGTRPSDGFLDSGIADRIQFDLQVNRGNDALNGYGYRLNVVEFVDITPPVPAGQSTSYWYDLYARDNRATIQAAAIADPVTWKWSAKAVNIYINNSSSGQCSFPPDLAITLGRSVGVGTVVHELGHFFHLFHTHPLDNNQTLVDWGDGDGLPETLPDDPDATLSDINARYPQETQQKRDDLYYNVMSYHEAVRLLPSQMAIWVATPTTHASRRAVLSPFTVYVGLTGNDVFNNGTLQSPYRTVPRAIDHVNSAGYQRSPWVISIEGGQSGSVPTYPVGNRISAACRIEPRGGTARIGQ